MLKKIFIISSSGFELFSLDPETEETDSVNSQLLSGLIHAILSLSEVLISSIKQIQFNNGILFIKSFSEFSIGILLKGKINDEELESYFNKIAKITSEILDKHVNSIITEPNFKEEIKFILSPILTIPTHKSIFYSTEEKNLSHIAIAGLYNAGKTSIIKKLFNRWTNGELNSILPTINIERTKKVQEYLNHSLNIIDFGGQELYRNQHLKNKEIWKDIKLIIFVVDLGEQNSFDSAFSYLQSIWKTIKEVNTYLPNISILFHKYDPNIQSELQNNVKLVIEKFSPILNISRIFFTSINDKTSDFAIMNSLLFSLPKTVIKILVQEIVIDTFESDILPFLGFSHKSDNFNEEFQKIKEEIYSWSRGWGFSLSKTIQDNWLKSIYDSNWIPTERNITKKRINIDISGNFLYIEIRNWENEGYPREVTDFAMTGLLEGIFSQFHFSKPELVSKDSNKSKWSFKF